MRVHNKDVEVYHADARIDVCLWMELRNKEGRSLSMENFGERSFRENLAYTLGEDRIRYLVNDISSRRLLSIKELEWIGEDERQLRWLSFYLHNEFWRTVYAVLPNLNGRRLLLTKLDFWDCDLSIKAAFVERMRYSWNEYVKGDSIFKWFQGEEEASRCAVAWEWLMEKKGAATRGHDRVSTYADLLIFFDGLHEGEAQKKLDVASIKSRWSQQKYRKKMVGKKQYNLLLSDKAIAELDKLALKYGVSKPQIIETLIQFEAAKGLYLPEKIKMMSSWGD